ncbi:hypothetical protein ACHAQA_006184 [Verticillium albo-atrum]
MAHRLDMQYVWRDVVPGIAYASPFLMHGILAVAALHKAHVVHAQRRTYADLAIYHQTAGLEGFRAALARLDAGDDNWKPSFCFSALIIISMCWQPVGGNGFAVTGTGATPRALDLFVFIAGIRAVLEPYQSNLSNTCFAPLAEPGWRDRADPTSFDKSLLRFSLLPGDIFEALDSATHFYETMLDGPSQKAYVDAVDELRRAVCMIATSGTQPESRMFMFVPYLIDDNVRLDIMACRPHAMIFLAHFAVLMRAYEACFWHFNGLAKRMFGVIDETLSRFPVHLEAVRWQRRHVFESYEA